MPANRLNGAEKATRDGLRVASLQLETARDSNVPTDQTLLYDQQEHKRAAELTSDFCARYLAGVADRPVFPQIDRVALRGVIEAPLPRTGLPLEALFDEFERIIVPNSTHTAHPRFLPYVQPSPNAVSPYAEQVAATVNQNCNLWALSPAANAVEQAVLRWFADAFGFGDEAGGIITSGGSVANLVGLTAARDHRLGGSARTRGLQGRSSRLIAYASEEVHSSIDKAISILGIGTENLRKVPTDADLRMDVAVLRQTIEEDRKAGGSPFCVIASAGTVTTGAIDPVEEIAQLCRAEDLWLHVDGAYGAMSVLSDRFRPRMSAIGLADSVSLDPHKFLFASFEAGCALVRDRHTLRHAFAASPSYLTLCEDPDFVDFASYGPQLSRGFKALKVWWSLKHFGADAFARVIERMVDLATYMGEQCEKRDAFELLAPVTFNCVCFRLRRLSAEGNKQALASLVDSGRAFLGPASVKGALGMRACFMNLRTKREDVDAVLDALAEHGAGG